MYLLENHYKLLLQAILRFLPGGSTLREILRFLPGGSTLREILRFLLGGSTLREILRFLLGGSTPGLRAGLLGVLGAAMSGPGFSACTGLRPCCFQALSDVLPLRG